jgi:NADPH-dependent 2,4-dienoyl-CoA reductase/sulfur reductase-like enzyme
MDEARAINSYIEEHRVKNALLIGAGYINLELADGLTKRGSNVTLIERNPAVLKTVDVALGDLVGQQLEAHGVVVLCGQRAVEITHHESCLSVGLERGKKLSTELVVVAIGARPETTLAQSAGAELGESGAIRINQRMETNLEHVYAAADCAETYHRIGGRNTYAPLGSTSHKQGRVAGENALGGSREFLGTVGTQVVKVFDLIAARTGLKDEDSKAFGFEPITISGEILGS